MGAWSTWAYNMLARDVLTLTELNELLGIEWLYRRTGIVPPWPR